MPKPNKSEDSNQQVNQAFNKHAIEGIERTLAFILMGAILGAILWPLILVVLSGKSTSVTEVFAYSFLGILLGTPSGLALDRFLAKLVNIVKPGNVSASNELNIEIGQLPRGDMPLHAVHPQQIITNNYRQYSQKIEQSRSGQVIGIDIVSEQAPKSDSAKRNK